MGQEMKVIFLIFISNDLKISDTYKCQIIVLTFVNNSFLANELITTKQVRFIIKSRLYVCVESINALLLELLFKKHNAE